MEYKSPSIHRSPEYRAKAAYSNMLRRCRGGNAQESAYSDVEVKMTKEEWLAWAVPEYEKFISENPDDKPSVSRKGDSGHYELGNVSIVSFRSNLKEQVRQDPQWRELVCPVCGTRFTRRANQVDFKIQQGGHPCCSRVCGSTYGNSKKRSSS